MKSQDSKPQSLPKPQNPLLIAGLVVGAIAIGLVVLNRFDAGPQAGSMQRSTDAMDKALCDINPQRPECK